MEKLARCRGAGLDCDFEARGQTNEEVLDLCIQHVRSVHGMDEKPVELAERILAASHEGEKELEAVATRVRRG
jgi:predicted small metal-binding protein